MKQIGLLMVLLLLFAVTSCGSTKPTVTDKEETTKTSVETIHDTVFKTKIDSSAYKALLECRGGKVVVKEVTQSEPGRKLKSPKVRVDNNQLNVDCEARAEELFASWKSKEVKETRYITITKTNFVNVLTFWQQFQIKGFRILSALILLYITWIIIKSKIKL